MKEVRREVEESGERKVMRNNQEEKEGGKKREEKEEKEGRKSIKMRDAHYTSLPHTPHHIPQPNITTLPLLCLIKH